MPDWFVYIGYVAMVVTIVFLSIKLGKYVDVIDAKSNISGAFIGGVMLAAVTSLPELFTSLSSVWIVKQNDLVIGNILGSDLINLAFLGIMLLLFGQGLRKAQFSKFYFVGIEVSLIMYGLVALGLYFTEWLQIGWYTVTSPLILALYVIYLQKMPKSADSGGDSVEDDSITLKQAVVRFIICAVILITASIAMTYLTDIVSDKIGLSDKKTFAGALFLGVATSLPELVSSSTLCLRKNYNAAAGNIIGSNIFNFTILFVADVFSFMPGSSNVYVQNSDAKWLLIFGVIASVTTFVMILVKNKGKEKTGALAGVQALNIIPPLLYVLYLLISTGVIAG